VPPEVFKDLAEQLVALKLIDAAAAAKDTANRLLRQSFMWMKLEKSRFLQTVMAVNRQGKPSKERMKHLTCLSRHRTKRPVLKKYFYAAAGLCGGHYGGAFCGRSLKALPPLWSRMRVKNETVGPMWVGH